MKIKKSSHKRLFIITGSTILALLVLVGGVYAYSQNQEPTPAATDTSNTSEIKESQTDAENTPTSTLPSKDHEAAPTSSTPEAGSDGEDKPAKAIETPRIERASQSGSEVKVVASLQNASSGKCEAKFEKGTSRITRTFSVVLGPSYYTCTFSIPVTDFSSGGDWLLTLSHIKGTSVASAKPQEVTVQK